jgi:hypothetical protein
MASDPHAIPELDRKGLRRFGLVTGAIVAGLFGVLVPFLLSAKAPVWPWVLAGVLGAWALLAPQTLRPLYRAWMRLGLLIGRVTTPLILGLVFVGLFLPMGLVMRLAGRDPMRRRFDPSATSYRVPAHTRTRESLERPF